jgi:hypothetical protein
MSKLETTEAGPVNREKLRQALDTAMEEYKDTDENERKAFLYGMLTGYAVALKVGDTSSQRKV